MHLVDEKDGAPAAQSERVLGGLHGLADVLDAGQHRGERDELRVERLGHEPRDRGLARPGRAPQDHRVRFARLEGDAQRLTRAEQVALADDLVQRARAKRVCERRCGLPLPKEVGHYSTRTSAPLGGSKRNSDLSIFGLRRKFMKRSTVRWPKWSKSSIARNSSATKPMRTRSNPASRSRGVASSHSSPSFFPPSDRSNAFSMSAEPARSAAGVEPSARESLRTVTWLRSRSWIQTRSPSPTITWSTGFAYTQRNRPGRWNAKAPLDSCVSLPERS